MMTLLINMLPFLLEGLNLTVKLTLLSALIAFFSALIVGFLLTMRYRTLRIILRIYVEIFRGTSLLLQLFWVFFVLPFFGINISAYLAGVIIIGLNAGAYGSEMVRGAVQAVPQGQTDAAIALNLTTLQRIRLVILPQALIRMLPPFGNLAIEILKSTPLLSTITVLELTFRTRILMDNMGHPTFFLGFLLIMYFLLALPLIMIVRWMERKFTIYTLED